MRRSVDRQHGAIDRRRLGAARRRRLGRSFGRSVAISAASSVGQPARLAAQRRFGFLRPGGLERRALGVGDQAGDGRHGGSSCRREVAIEALVVIGGSTASGKSSLALALAQAIGGVVINADSQQLFADLPRPHRAADAARTRPLVPHRLYGVLAADEQPSVGRWLDAGRARARRVPRRPAGRRSSPAAPAFTCTHCCTACPTCPRCRRSCGQPCAPGPPRVRPRSTPRPPRRTRSASMAARLSARATRSGCCGRWRSSRLPAARWPSGRRSPACGCRCRGAVRCGARAAGRLVNPRIEARLDAMLAGGALAEVAALLERRPGRAAAADRQGPRPARARGGERGELAPDAARAASPSNPPLRQAPAHLVPAPASGARGRVDAR